MKLLHLRHVSIFKQLQLEEALLRTGDDNICVINEGSSPAIVMGISCKMEEAIDLNRLAKAPIPVIRRYSGGGTVVVDESTLFVSFICNKTFVDCKPYPKPLLRWFAALYNKAWPAIGFDLQENDYVIGGRKVGGNAQYFTKGRFVHHTTFLWDYERQRMDLLAFPKKTPSYRRGRTHEMFVTRLREHYGDRDAFVGAFKDVLKQSLQVVEVPRSTFDPVLTLAYRKSTSLCSCPINPTLLQNL